MAEYERSEKDDLLFQFIEEHHTRRPTMETQDVYKMLYQSILGPGHIMGADAREKLEKELEGVEPIKAGVPSTFVPYNDQLIENIFPQKVEASGEKSSPDERIVRINLSPFKCEGFSAGKLFEAMRISSEQIKGTKEEFIDLWERVVKIYAQATYASLSGVERFQSWLESWKYPQVSHTMLYTRSHKPAYRVVKKDVFEKLIHPI